MHDPREATRRLVEWWTERTSGYDVETELTSDFGYDDRGIQVLSRDEFRWTVEHSGGWSAVRLIQIVAEAETAVAFFEGVDEVTALPHRKAWLVRFRNGQVCSILGTGAILPFVSSGG